MAQFFGAVCAIAFFGGLVLGDCTGNIDGRRQALIGACGPCDHVGECGEYECRAGVSGWQKKH
jgi:hypothetical protein